LKLDTSRAIRVNSSIPFFESHKVKSYDVRVVRTTTADVERVQIRRHEVTTTEAGEEEISGIVKNISDVKTDAAVVWTFYDPKKENIGTKVVILRDMEPNAIRQYGFRFKPQEGDTVRSYNIIVGEIAG
jgi:acylphosphatase